MCVAQGLPAESHLDGVELIFKPLKARFFWLCGAARPQAGVAAGAASVSLRAAGTGVVSRLLPDPNPQHLPGDPSVCDFIEVTPPCVILSPGFERADVWDQSLCLSPFLGRDRTPSLRATTSLPLSVPSLSSAFFGTFPPTSSSTGCFLFSPQPRGRHSVPSSELGSPFP